MRKYKQVKRKEVVFSLGEWAKVEKQAAAVEMKTSDYIRTMSVNGKVVSVSRTENTEALVNVLRIIGININQLAKKANEINCIYADDYEKLKGEYEKICLTLNQYLFTPQ